MLKKLLNISILTLSIFAILIASFSYSIFAFDNKYINQTISTVDSGNYNIFNTKYVQELSGDIAKLYNDSSLLNRNGNSYGTSGDIPDLNSEPLYFVATFNPQTIAGTDALVDSGLLYFYLMVGGNYEMNNLVGILSGSSTSSITWEGITFSKQVRDYDLSSGKIYSYNEALALGYRRFTTTDFYYNSHRYFIVTFYKMGQNVLSHSVTENVNSSNYQNEILFDRFEIPTFSIDNQWSYADFFIQSSCLSIYDKSDNIQLKSIDDSNGVFYLRIYNNGETGFITLCNVVPVTTVYNTNPTYTSKLFTFYYDSNFNPNDYGSYLNTLIQNTDDIETYLTTQNSLINNQLNTLISIYNSLLYIDNKGGQWYSFEYMINQNSQSINLLSRIVDLLNDLQVTEINNIYNDIINNYNIDIDTEINNYLDDLQLNINALDINNPKFQVPSNLNDQLTGLKDTFNNVFTTFDNNAAAIFYIVPIVALIIGALL